VPEILLSVQYLLLSSGARYECINRNNCPS